MCICGANIWILNFYLSFIKAGMRASSSRCFQLTIGVQQTHVMRAVYCVCALSGAIERQYLPRKSFKSPYI